MTIGTAVGRGPGFRGIMLAMESPVDTLHNIISRELLLSTNRRGERALPGRAILRQRPETREVLATLKSQDIANPSPGR